MALVFCIIKGKPIFSLWDDLFPVFFHKLTLPCI